MPQTSAGLLMYRKRDGAIEVLLVHPGGPFFAKKDVGAWTIPKGEVEAGEDPLAAARREFVEEVGSEAAGDFLPLGSVRQKGGKVVHAWAVAGDLDAASIKSNTFSVEWPPKSGRWQEFPEVDRAAFFDLPTARKKINAAQVELLDAVEQLAG